MNYNVTKNISDYENDRMDDASIDKLFQHLVDTGQVWEMEAGYGKKAVELAEARRISFPDFGLDTTYWYGP
jgi:hypothetical protein